MGTRKYTQRKRAERQEQTRNRIVEATMDLHEDLGAARTTVSAVAERAGVQRLTVYRHFPDEASLLHACTTRWLELNPFPARESWDGVEDPWERARVALRAFYPYYRRTERMWGSSYRDVDLVPALAERMAQVEAYLDGVARDLVAPMRLQRKVRSRVLTTVRHGLRFSTWRSLTEGGLSDHEGAALVGSWIGSAGGGR